MMKNIFNIVLALLCFFVVNSVAQVCPEGSRHPIIFFPGIFGTRIDENFNISSSMPLIHPSCPRQSKGWEPGWVEWKKILPTNNFDCLMERFSVFPNEAGDKWNDYPGTQFRIPNWGLIGSIDPLSVELSSVVRMYGWGMDKLKKLGYEDGKTLFAASFDWRRIQNDDWRDDVRQLVENAVQKTGKKAVLFSHSMGCPTSYIFLMKQPLEWRQKYIERWIPVSPVWIGTNIIPFAMVTKKIFNITIQPFAELGSLFRYMESSYLLSPSLIHEPDTVIGKTDLNVYTARNYSMLLERVGIKNAEVLLSNAQKQLFRYNFEHPGIPITTLWSTGANTLGPLMWQKDSDVGVQEPLPQFIEGDGLVPHDSLTFAYNIWMKSPYANITEGIPVPGTNHASAPHCDAAIASIFSAACDN